MTIQQNGSGNMKTQEITWGGVVVGDVIIVGGYIWAVTDVDIKDQENGNVVRAVCTVTEDDINDDIRNTGYNTSCLGAFDWVEVTKVI